MIKRTDFKEEGKNQWVAEDGTHRYLVRKLDGAYEVVIRALITSDPSDEDWNDALHVINQFRKHKRIAENYLAEGSVDNVGLRLDD